MRWFQRLAGMTTALLIAASASTLTQSASASTSNAASVAVSPNGAYLYAGFDGAGFSVFSRNPGTGLLTVTNEASTSDTAGAIESPGIAATADGLNVYGVDGQSNTLDQYAGSGSPALQASYPVLSDPTVAKDPIDVAASPDGQDVYVLTYGVQYGSGIGVSSAGKISQFARDGSDGDLTLVGTTAVNPSSPGGVGDDLVTSPDSRDVYVAGDGSLQVFGRAGPDQMLSPVSDGTDTSSIDSEGVAISPDGGSVYASGTTNGSTVIEALSRNADTGELTPVQQIQTGTAASTEGSMDLAVSPDGDCLYETDEQGDVLRWFTRNPATSELTDGGALAEGQEGIAGLDSPNQVTTVGDDIYVAGTGDNGVAVFRRGSATTCAPTFSQLAQDLFSLSPAVVNPTTGTASLPASFLSAGTATLTVTPSGSSGANRRAEDTSSFDIPGPGTRALAISVSGAAASTLKDTGSLAVQVTVTFTAANGTPTTKTASVTLSERAGGTGSSGTSSSSTSSRSSATFAKPRYRNGEETLGVRLPANEWARQIDLDLPTGSSLATRLTARTVRRYLTVTRGDSRRSVGYRLLKIVDGGQQIRISPDRHLGELILRVDIEHLVLRGRLRSDLTRHRLHAIRATLRITSSTGRTSTEPVSLTARITRGGSTDSRRRSSPR